MNEYCSPYDIGFVFALNGTLKPLKSEPCRFFGGGVFINPECLGFTGSQVIGRSDFITVRFVPYSNGIDKQINKVSTEVLIFYISILELTQPEYDLVTINTVDEFFFFFA